MHSVLGGVGGSVVLVILVVVVEVARIVAVVAAAARRALNDDLTHDGCGRSSNRGVYRRHMIAGEVPHRLSATPTCRGAVRGAHRAGRRAG